MRVHRTRALVTGATAAVLVGTLVGTLLGACAGNPQIELTQAGDGSRAAPTVSRTVPTTGIPATTTPVTTTVTATAVVTRTVVATPTVTVTVTAGQAPTVRSPYDQARSVAAHQAVVGDIATLDAMTISGPAAASALTVLSGHLSALLAMAAPPGLDPPSYYARVTSLRIFVDAAAQEAQAQSPQAPARYTIIRTETGLLLSMVNGAIGAALSLPPAPATTSPPLLTTH